MSLEERKLSIATVLASQIGLVAPTKDGSRTEMRVRVIKCEFPGKIPLLKKEEID